MRGVELLVGSFASIWQKLLAKAKYSYFKKGLKKNKNNLAKFYTIIKVYKILLLSDQ